MHPDEELKQGQLRKSNLRRKKMNSFDVTVSLLSLNKKIEEEILVLGLHSKVLVVGELQGWHI